MRFGQENNRLFLPAVAAALILRGFGERVRGISKGDVMAGLPKAFAYYGRELRLAGDKQDRPRFRTSRGTFLFSGWGSAPEQGPRPGRSATRSRVVGSEAGGSKFSLPLFGGADYRCASLARCPPPPSRTLTEYYLPKGVGLWLHRDKAAAGDEKLPEIRKVGRIEL